MEIAKISVTGNLLKVTERTPITAGTIGAEVAFTFDHSWDRLQKTYVWTDGVVTKDDLSGTGIVPWEVVATAGRRLRVGVFGSGEGVATPTIWADLGRILEAADPSGDESADPQLPVWAQLAERVEALEETGGGGGIAEETDPTVPDWAKQPNPPSVDIPQKLPNPHKLTLTGAVSAEYDGSKAVSVEIPQGGTDGAKKWDLLGEYTFAEDAPVAAITLTELPNYTEFMVYFEGTYTTAATGDISFFINDVRVYGFSSIDYLYGRAHLYIQDRWRCDCTDRRTAQAFAVPVFSDNYRAVDLTDAAVSLRIQNQYGASSFKNGTVVIYGAK